MANPTITDAQLEELLSSNKAQAVNRAPIVAGEPSVPPQFDPLAGGVLPDVFGGLQTDVARSQVPGALPTYRVAKLAPSGQPQQGSAIISGIKTTPTETKTTSDTVELIVPSIFTPTDQTANLPGPLEIDLAVEQPNTVFAGPAGASGGLGLDSGVFAFGTGSLIAISNTLSQPNEWAVVASSGMVSSVTASPGAGWTQLFTNGLFEKIYSQQFPAVGTVTVNQTISISSKWTAVLGLFGTSGVAPAIVQATQHESVSAGDNSVAFVSNVTSGNAIIAVAFFTGIGATPIPVTVTDTLGNPFVNVGQTFITGTGAFSDSGTAMLFSSPINGGVDTIHFHTASDDTLDYMVIFEVSGIVGLPGIPTFRKLVEGDLPVVDVPHGGTGDTSLAAHSVLIGEGTSPVNVVLPGAAGQVLTSNGSAADPTWQAPGGGGTAVEINGAGVSSDKQFYFNGVADVVSVWGVQINGVAG